MRCMNCGILIRWQPTIVEGRAYCCMGCVEGGPCTCDYSTLPGRGDNRPIVVAHNPHPSIYHPNHSTEEEYYG
jgi:hypothetical protein